MKGRPGRTHGVSTYTSNTHIEFLHVTLWRTVKHVYNPFETYVRGRWSTSGGDGTTEVDDDEAGVDGDDGMDADEGRSRDARRDSRDGTDS